MNEHEDRRNDTLLRETISALRSNATASADLTAKIGQAIDRMEANVNKACAEMSSTRAEMSGYLDLARKVEKARETSAGRLWTVLCSVGRVMKTPIAVILGAVGAWFATRIGSQ